MMPSVNVDPETGIRYGCIDAKSVPFLMDDIMSNGTNVTFEDARNAFLEALQSCQSRDDLFQVLREYGLEEIDFDDNDVQFPLSENTIDDILSQWEETYESMEDEYEYATELPGQGQFCCFLTYLQSPILLITRSPFVTYCRECSPCVPNAGDLDSLCGQDDPKSVLAYCVPPDDLKESLDENQEIVSEPYEQHTLLKVVTKTRT